MQIAIIGHGRSPEGQGWGQQIDGCDAVVRMWNWHWQAPIDYGTRYDWGLIEAHRRALPQWREHNRHAPTQGWLGSLLISDRELARKFPERTQIVDQSAFFDVLPRKQRGCGETLNWQLTRGGVAACWAISQASKGDSIILVGFDVIRAGIAPAVEDAFSPEYMASAGYYGIGSYAEGKTKEGNHDYPAERRLIMAMAKQAGVTVSFAQDIWPFARQAEPVRRASTKGNGLMKFYYVGEYPASGSVTCWGHEFKPGEAVELPEQFAAKAKANRFFEEVVPEEPVEPEGPRNRLLDAEPDKAALVSEAEAKGVKIDKRWSAQKIAAAIKDAENGE